MRTMQDEPPQLDRTGGAHKYSKLMDDFVRQCLQKDPEKRPTAEKLLSHGFFKQAKGQKHLISTVLAGLPPLAERQERRRLASINSTQHYLSWDFDTISSRTNTPNLDKLDPFRNFTGVISLPSPHGSVRSTKLVSIDGQHVLAAEQNDTSLMRRFSSFDESPTKDAMTQGTAGKRRGRSADTSLSHRKSVSFGDAEGSNGQNAPEDGGGHAALAPIGETASPMTMAAESRSSGEEPSDLKLSPDVVAADKTTPVISTPVVKSPVLPPKSNAGDFSQQSDGTMTTSPGSSPQQRSISSTSTATFKSQRAGEDQGAAVGHAAPAPPQSMLRRISDRSQDKAEAEGAPATSRHRKRDSVFGKLFKGASSNRKEGKV